MSDDVTPESVTLASLLLSHMERAGVTVYALAKLGGVPEQSARDVLLGTATRGPRADTLTALARGLKLTPKQYGEILYAAFPPQRSCRVPPTDFDC